MEPRKQNPRFLSEGRRYNVDPPSTERTFFPLVGWSGADSPRLQNKLLL